MTISKNDKKIIIIDLNINNVGSVFRALKSFEENVFISDKTKDLARATHIILPGVGTYENGIKKLNSSDLAESLKSLVTIKKVPILGICLGMQLFSTKGYENNKVTNGLNLIEGEVIKFDIDKQFKWPHVGWNSVNFLNKSSLFSGISNNSDFYFTHGYHFSCKNNDNISSNTDYGINFCSSIKKSNIFGVQFHPEKSLKNGIKLLKNFVNF